MKKKFIVVVGIVIISALLSFFISMVFNDPAIDEGKVVVHIKTEFQQEFEAEQFSMQDFEWSNIKNLTYYSWYPNASEPYGLIIIHLEEIGKTRVLDAIENFNTLEFVKGAYTISQGNFY